MRTISQTNNIQPGVAPAQAFRTRHNIPYSGANVFVGRDNELNCLHDYLQEDDYVAICAVAGMGGIGKTELAIQYALTQSNFYKNGICWIDSRDVDIPEQILRFSQINLGLDVPEQIGGIKLTLQQQVSWCWQNWTGSELVLIIFDDVSNYKKIIPYLPPAKSRFRVLITTRLKSPSIRTLALDVLPRELSINLLELNTLAGKERIEEEQNITNTLCEWLGDLPLGLELVGRYLHQEPSLSLAEMLFRLQRKALAHEALNLDQEDPFWCLTAQRGVAAAFELSWEVLDTTTKRLGCLLSLFAEAPIPWDLVELAEQKRCTDSPNLELFDQGHLIEARQTLLYLHLLQYQNQNIYRLHSLIHKFFRSKMR